MNLLSLIPVKEENLKHSQEDVLRLDTLKTESFEALGKRNDSIDFLRDTLGKEDSTLKWLSKLNQNALVDYIIERDKFYKNTGSLPENHKMKPSFDDRVIETDDGLFNLGKLPVTNVEFVKNIADKLKFIIIPFEYYCDTFFDSAGEESESIKNYVTGCVNKHKDKFSYILCPSSYLDLNNAIESSTIKDCYFPGEYFMSFSPLMMQLPILQSFNNRIDKLEKSVETLEEDMKIVNTQVQQITKQLKIINARLDQQEEMRIQERLKARNRELEIEQQAKRVVRPFDPMLFFSNTEIDFVMDADKELKLIAAWGPDFTDSVADAIGLTPVRKTPLKLHKISI